MRATSGGVYNWVLLYIWKWALHLGIFLFSGIWVFFNKKAKNIGELILQYVIIMLDITLPGYKYRRNKNPKKLWKYMYSFVL
jgi:hypothetical protein